MPDGVSEILRLVDRWERRAYPVRWSLRDTITYAIATGADARNARSLVWESAPGFTTLPTFATRFAHAALTDFAAGVQDAGLPSFARAWRVSLDRPLAPECAGARASADLRVKERSGDRLVLTLDVETRADGERIARSSLDVHFRLPGERPPARRPTPPATGADASPGHGRAVTVRERVHPYQAAVFRTLLGLTACGSVQDAMHIDPVRARELGLAAPALPGEVTLGIVARLAERTLGPVGLRGLRGAEVSYRSPVSDADRLTITYTPGRDGTAEALVRNGQGRTAVSGVLRFETEPTRSVSGEAP
ncbi:hypothetical protein [Actinomadura livida]|uniref:MaoC-like domain-containing protein n=1 Tax=Actinomadura livida TaxID=79909 RepID=A0A7W7IFE7_9ACTN|nr:MULTISPECIES: hypothetical protein [Actinomadura]MBB4775990.1 hypothetical protein [Actinomadura catellatispora]GGU16282.1 hypothetical protein GCM10010208_46750 [Actinomadura livida]